tara:strand:+ start:2615 stop:2827 length:213 start_codon:yes stop_codon:yes gene_type:complete
MGLLSWIIGETKIERVHRENEIVVKTLKSKGKSKIPVNVTIGDIKQGIVTDPNGYKNEVVLFLRKNKKDR